MTKDYAPKVKRGPHPFRFDFWRGKSARGKGARQKNAAFSPGSFFAGVGCCAALALAIDLGRALFGADAGSDGATPGIAAAEVAADTAPALTYEFINRLPADVVKTNVERYEPSTAKAAEAADPRVYLLQAAAFPHADDADMMRAELLLAGMQVSLNKVPRAGGGDWHRVMVGPFPNRKEMQRALSQLRARDIPALPLVRNAVPSPR